MARFNQRTERTPKPIDKAADIAKKIRKTKSVEPIQPNAAKPLITLKAKIPSQKPDNTKQLRKFFSEYRKKEEAHINEKKLSKTDRAKFLKKSSLLRKKKLVEFMKNPDMRIDLNEIGAALDEVKPVSVKHSAGKVSNKAFVRNQAVDLERMQKVAQHPVFQANPVETLKTHLRNTLLKK